MGNYQITFLGILIENKESIPEINHTLSEYGSIIIGRMGLPHQRKEYNIISIIIEANKEIFNDLNTRLKRLDGVTTTFSCL